MNTKHSKSTSLQQYGATRGRLLQRARSLGLNGGGAAVSVATCTSVTVKGNSDVTKLTNLLGSLLLLWLLLLLLLLLCCHGSKLLLLNHHLLLTLLIHLHTRYIVIHTDI